MTQAEDKIIYEYCVIRYVPDIERQEFVNVGLLMMSKRMKWLRCHINIDEQRIRALFGDSDIELLRKQIEIFRNGEVPFKGLPVEEKYRWMAAVKSAIIQTSPSHPGIIVASNEEGASSLDKKFRELSSRLVG